MIRSGGSHPRWAGVTRRAVSRQSWTFASVLLIAAALGTKAFGFLREVVVASYFGAGADVDAYRVALTLATLASGIGPAFAAVLIPLHGRLIAERTSEDARRLAGGAVTVTVGLSMIWVGLLLAAPGHLVALVAPDLPAATAIRAVDLTRWIALFVLATNLFYLFTSVYNAREHFATPAILDFVSSIAVIVILITLAGRMGIRALALSVGLASLLAVFLMGGPIIAQRLATFSSDLRTANVGELVLLAIPVFFLELLTQATGLVENFFGARLEVGSIAALGFARRLSSFVASLVALNVARAIFPLLSRLIAESRTADAREVFSHLCRQFAISFIPISIAFIYFSQEIVGAVYLRGAFTEAAAARTASALAYYAVGGVLFAMMPLFVRACYAFSDTITPCAASGCILLGAGILSYVLTPPLGVRGIALGISAGTAVGVAVMWRTLSRRFSGLPLTPLIQVSCTAIVCAVLSLSSIALRNALGIRGDVSGLVIGLLLYFAIYAGLAWFSMRREFQGLLILLRRST